MADKTDRYLILVTDPDEVQWTIIHQTTDADEAMDFWSDNVGDPSKRILINTSNFINFEIPSTEE